MPLAKLARRGQLAIKALGAIGLKRTAQRMQYQVALRSGWLRKRYPAGNLTSWLPDSRQLAQILQRVREHGLLNRVEPTKLRAEYPRLFPEIGPRLLADADRFAAGEMEYFSKHWAPFDARTGWFTNPFTGQQVAGNRHWTQTSWDSRVSGDLKFQLEPARFAWVYKLVRAYWYTGEEKYAAAFWRLFEGWCEQNPPQAGPLWICGQESSLRLMAMAFGLQGFAWSPESTDARTAQLVGMIAAHVDRVGATTMYARSQQNNHALSEGAGMLTAGILLAEYPAAQHWLEHAQKLLAEQVPLQIYDDGAYTQHSHNYHRVMLNVLSWSVRMAEHHDHRLADDIYRRLGLAARFLGAMLDPDSGLASNYGHNDGALILPLSALRYGDFRPAVQSAGFIATGEFSFGAGDFNEELLWMAGLPAAEQAQRPDRGGLGDKPISFPIGGYEIVRGRPGWGMMRAARYHDRPGQADQLHFDVWWRGVNVACDAGTYLYNGAPPWQNGLAATSVHNTITVDDQSQMTAASRFLWVDWAQAQCERFRSQHGLLELLRAEHNGYQRLEAGLVHRREVLRLGDEHWLVIDSVTAPSPHRYRLHWLSPNLPHSWDETAHRLELKTDAGPYEIQMGLWEVTRCASLVSGDSTSIRGWRSRFYGDREEALSIALETRATNARFWSLLGPAGSEVRVADGNIQVTTANWNGTIELATTGTLPGISSVQYSGVQVDILRVAARTTHHDKAR